MLVTTINPSDKPLITPKPRRCELFVIRCVSRHFFPTILVGVAHSLKKTNDSHSPFFQLFFGLRELWNFDVFVTNHKVVSVVRHHNRVIAMHPHPKEKTVGSHYGFQRNGNPVRFSDRKHQIRKKVSPTRCWEIIQMEGFLQLPQFKNRRFVTTDHSQKIVSRLSCDWSDRFSNLNYVCSDIFIPLRGWESFRHLFG